VAAKGMKPAALTTEGLPGSAWRMKSLSGIKLINNHSLG
jgi:hypothetical protein